MEFHRYQRLGIVTCATEVPNLTVSRCDVASRHNALSAQSGNASRMCWCTRKQQSKPDRADNFYCCLPVAPADFAFFRFHVRISSHKEPSESQRSRPSCPSKYLARACTTPGRIRLRCLDAVVFLLLGTLRNRKVEKVRVRAINFLSFCSNRKRRPLLA